MTAEGIAKRMSAYPIMLDVTDRAVLVVGGGAVGERRTGGLLEAGARVTLVAPQATEALAQLAQGGSVVWHRRDFTPDDVAGAVLVFAATGIGYVDDAVAAAARVACIPVSTADDRSGCDFHVPAVARRGDIVIAVGTGGAAPALAARLRDRFAASLGPEWERLADLLGRMRDVARERIADRSERMGTLAFASREDALLAALARGVDVDASDALEAARLAAAGEAGTEPTAARPADIPQRARVSLVGAGPGAPDLLTLRAVQRVREADVIVYDDLVDRRVLAQAAPQAELVYCGKRGWRAGPERPGPELLAERALEGGGRHVVRLKGGDPNIFGRSAEEIAALEAAGVPFDIVPGVTAVFAAAAAARVPLTERGVSANVTLVTGTAAAGPRKGAESARPADIARLAASGGTVAVHMGLRALPDIVEGLLCGGVRPDLPAVVVGAASLPEERVVSGTISDIVALTIESAIPSPAMLILGEVAR